MKGGVRETEKGEREKERGKETANSQDRAQKAAEAEAKNYEWGGGGNADLS
jgi:hypothetical protein